MSELLTSSEMRAREAQAIDSGRVTGRALMETAGQGVFDAICAGWPGGTGPDGQVVAVLCGPGNNGGDGYVVARLLRETGADVHVLNIGDPERLPRDAADAFRGWAGEVTGMTEAALQSVADLATARGQEALVFVDALFGIGQRAPLDSVTAPVMACVDRLTAAANGPHPWFAAIDVPTGYDTDTGSALCERPLPADLIITFQARKPVHVTQALAGASLSVVDIGV